MPVPAAPAPVPPKLPDLPAPSPPDPGSAVREAPGESVPTAATDLRAAPPPRSATERKYGNLRTSYRILLHVARQGRTPPGEIPPIGLTQKGMIEALELGQGTLAGPLQRLVRSGALVVERSHARGADRRLKVYQLTPFGERLVEELRRRESGHPSRPRAGPGRAPSPPSAGGPDPDPKESSRRRTAGRPSQESGVDTIESSGPLVENK